MIESLIEVLITINDDYRPTRITPEKYNVILNEVGMLHTSIFSSLHTRLPPTHSGSETQNNPILALIPHIQTKIRGNDIRVEVDVNI